MLGAVYLFDWPVSNLLLASTERPMARGSLAGLERLVVLGGEFGSTSSMGLDRPLLDRSNRLNREWVGRSGGGLEVRMRRPAPIAALS